MATNPTVEGEATAVYLRAAQAAGRESHAHRHGRSRGQRPRIRRRSHHVESHGRPARNVSWSPGLSPSHFHGTLRSTLSYFPS